MAIIYLLFRGYGFELISFTLALLFELFVEKLVLRGVKRLFTLPLEFTFLQVFTYQG